MKLLLKIFLLLVLNCNFAFSADSYVADGEFWAVEDDSSKFVKQQLKMSALKDAMNKFFAQMELNSSVFWQILDREILSDLENRKNSVDQKIEKAREAQEFEKVLNLETEWRRYRLNYISKFLESRRLYYGFSSSGVTASMVNPQLKMAKFKVSLNRNAVKKLYFDMTKSDSNRHYQNLIISLRIEKGPSFNDVSPELNEGLGLVKKAILEKWVSWLSEEYKDVFSNILIASEVQERQLGKYIFSPPGSVNFVDMSMVKRKQEDLILKENGGEEVLSTDSSSGSELESINKAVTRSSENEMNIFKDSQWVQVKIVLSDIELDQNFKKTRIKISGGHLFADLNSREIILFDDYREDARILSYLDMNTFASELGTVLFNLPLNGFRSGKKIFTKAPQINNQAHLTIQNVTKPEDIISLSDFLNLGGNSVNLKVRSFDLTSNGARITLNYFGELENLKNKFNEWQNKKVIPKSRWQFYPQSSDLIAELVPDGVEPEEQQESQDSADGKL